MLNNYLYILLKPSNTISKKSMPLPNTIEFISLMINIKLTQFKSYRQVIQLKMSKVEPDNAAKALKSWDSSHSDLYTHLAELISDIPSNTVNGVVHFERISEFFKKTHFRKDEPLSQQKLAAKHSKTVEYPSWLIEQKNGIQNARRIAKQVISEKKAETNIQNFQRDNANLFINAGISFGLEQSYCIEACIKAMADKYTMKSLRFFGKIIGRNNDYFVIQGQEKKNKDPERITDDTQPYGEGANYYSFWVCNKIAIDPTQWIQLPMVTPEQMRVSKLMKYFFSGKLTAPLKGYPIFSGEQRHFLKCQLARIVHNCQIVPNNLYAKNEQNPDIIQFSQEFKMPEFGDLTNLQNWVHLNPYLLQSGRAKHYAPSTLTPQQKDQLMGKLSETDPPIQRLKQLNEDKPVEKLGMEGCWYAKQIGNLQVFNNVGKDEGTTSCYGCVILRNPHWPGWITTANTKNFGSIYIGTGMKLTQSAFYPMTNEDLFIEGQDMDQFDEPNPRDPPDELEPDSDDQNKKQEEG